MKINKILEQSVNEDKKRKILRLKGGKLVSEEKKVNIQKKEKDKRSLVRGLSLVGELGFAISIPLVGGILLGVYLDRKFSSFPKLTLSFLFFGILVSFMNLFVIVREFTKEN